MWKGSCITVDKMEAVSPFFIAFQNALPKQMTLLFLGAALSSPQLEQAYGELSLPQSGQFVEVTAQKKRILPLASRSATRRQRTATTSPRSLMVAVCFNQDGTKLGGTRKIRRKIALVCEERLPRFSLLAATRSILIAEPI